MTLKYLSEEPDRHGNDRLYFRRRGQPRVRMHQTPGTEAFMEEYKAALAKTPAIKAAAPGRILPGTLHWLLIEYKKSPDFLRLDAATQTVRRRQLDAIIPKWGSGQVDELTPRYVKKIRDEDHLKNPKNPTPHAANNLLKALRVLFAWAVEAEHMTSNPARDVKKITTAGDGHHTWTVAEIRQYLERHPYHTKAGLALALLLFLGVRRSDVVKLGRQMESDDGTYIRVVESKGASKISKVDDLPILSVLRSVLDQHPGSMTYLLTGFGKPFTAAGFGNWFKDRCREANLPHCSAHGLRKAGATIAADNGATGHQLMALYGWTSPQQAAHYTKRANRKQLAADASRLVNEDQKLNLGAAPKPQVTAGAGKVPKKA